MVVVVMKDLLMQLSVETYSFYFAWKDKKHDKKLFSVAVNKEFLSLLVRQ